VNDDPNELPDGWTLSDRGPVSPSGRLYDVIPQGYELADLAIFDAIIDELKAELKREAIPST
jgi:hypothetical protein